MSGSAGGSRSRAAGWGMVSRHPGSCGLLEWKTQIEIGKAVKSREVIGATMVSSVANEVVRLVSKPWKSCERLQLQPRQRRGNHDERAEPRRRWSSRRPGTAYIAGRGGVVGVVTKFDQAARLECDRFPSWTHHGLRKFPVGAAPLHP